MRRLCIAEMKKIFIGLFLIEIVIVLIMQFYGFDILMQSSKRDSYYQKIIEADDLQMLSEQNTYFKESNCEIYNAIDSSKTQKQPFSILPYYFQENINFSCLNTKLKEKKVILLWNNFKPVSGLHKNLIGICPITNCHITQNTKIANRSDVILFNMDYKIKEFPKERNKSQIWVFYKAKYPVPIDNLTIYENKFNWSMSYKSDSQFSSIYFQNILRYSAKTTDIDTTEFETKNAIAVSAFLNDCNPPSLKKEFLTELNKHIPVHIFGKCGKYYCHADSKDKKESLFTCGEFFDANYKFFVAFEDQICDDYISDDFFEVIKYNLIPIVLKDNGYTKYVPKSAFIAASDFTSVKHLSDYISYLSHNMTEFLSYFKWKEHVKFSQITSRETKFLYQLCEVCIRAHLNTVFSIKDEIETNLNEKFRFKNNCYNLSVKEAPFLIYSNYSQEDKSILAKFKKMISNKMN